MHRLLTARLVTARSLAALMLASAGLCAHAAEGEVKKIDTAQARVAIQHDGIQNLKMPPMTMVFKVQDPKVLTALAVGDHVQFTADKVDGQYTVTSIQKK
jgi:Cu/Ag efflux protein CusF